MGLPFEQNEKEEKKVKAMEKATVWRSGEACWLNLIVFLFFGAFLSKLMSFFIANDIGMTWASCKLNLERI